MLRFEEYLEQFTNEINITDFLIGFILTALLALLIRWFYVNYGAAVSNRRRFANNFMPLAMTTMLIITIVKSSLALSLGLVGALSIVRFRAAIKDPEELVYLFLTIGLGLAAGAGHFVLAVVAVPIILVFLFLHHRFYGQRVTDEQGSVFININTDSEDLSAITDLLTTTFAQVNLKRMDTLSPGYDLSFSCKAENLQQLETISKALKTISTNTTISIIDQPDLV